MFVKISGIDCNCYNTKTYYSDEQDPSIYEWSNTLYN